MPTVTEIGEPAALNFSSFHGVVDLGPVCVTEAGKKTFYCGAHASKNSTTFRTLVYQVRQDKPSDDTDNCRHKLRHFSLLTPRIEHLEQQWRGSQSSPAITVERLTRGVVLHHKLNFTGHRNFGALGPTNQSGLETVEGHLEVAWQRW